MQKEQKVLSKGQVCAESLSLATMKSSSLPTLTGSATELVPKQPSL